MMAFENYDYMIYIYIYYMVIILILIKSYCEFIEILKLNDKWKLFQYINSL